MNELFIIIFLILLNGVLSLSEIALISARKTFLTNEEKKGSKAAKVALKLANEPEHFLSTIQIGITIIGLLTGLFSGSMFADELSNIFIGWGLKENIAFPLAQGIIVVIVTYVTVVFGELVPKRIGMSAAEKAAIIVAQPMKWLAKATYPFVWLLSKSTSLVCNLFGVKGESGKITEEEIISMIQEGTEDGEIQSVEQDIMERVLLLGDLRVSSLMTYRADIVYLDINMTALEVLNVMKDNVFEAYPVVDHDIDHVKGMVRLKDLIFALNKEDFNLTDVMVAPRFFHENMNVFNVMDEMKQVHVSQALICDEFGSCQGIITLKDILGGLVNTPSESHPDADIVKRKEDDGWFVDGQCSLYDFLLFLEKEELYDNNYDFSTVGGLILDELGHIPEVGEVVEWKQFRFEVLDMDGARIDKVLTTIEENEYEDDDNISDNKNDNN